MKKILKSTLAMTSALTMLCSAMPAVYTADNSAEYDTARSSRLIRSVAAEESEIFRDTFESGEGDWSGRGSASVSSSSNAKFQGSKSLFVEGREATWNGATKALSDTVFTAGQEYSFSANVMCPVENKKTLFHLTLQYNGSDGEAHYDKIASNTSIGGDWLQLSNLSYTIPADATDMYIYVETESGTSDFYIDDIVAAPKGTKISGAGLSLVRGDVTCDGVVDVFDLIAMRQGITGEFADNKSAINADADNNGEAAVNDLLLISQFVLGEISEFPQGEPITPPEPEKVPFEYNANLQYKSAPDYYQSPSSKAGRIIKETYTGINGSKQLNVYLPYGYDETKQYNIFYLMHGGGENENTIFSDDVNLDLILDHMIENGDIEPMIVVTPTFNGGNCSAQNFYNEFRQSVVPFVEGKYSTYAKDTSAEAINASRMHRAYGGFSMGSVSTWAVMQNCLDMVGYFMPLSGDHWSGNSAQEKANSITSAIDKSGLTQREYFIFAATGSDDIAYPNIGPQIEAMKPMNKYFTYTSDFSKGNLYFLVAPGLTHWWGYVKHYVYDALPYFFHE